MVSVPVEINMGRSEDEASYWKTDYTEILWLGFTLNFNLTAPDCGGCKSSGRSRGFDDNSLFTYNS